MFSPLLLRLEFFLKQFGEWIKKFLFIFPLFFSSKIGEWEFVPFIFLLSRQSHTLQKHNLKYATYIILPMPPWSPSPNSLWGRIIRPHLCKRSCLPSCTSRILLHIWLQWYLLDKIDFQSWKYFFWSIWIIY